MLALCVFACVAAIGVVDLAIPVYVKHARVTHQPAGEPWLESAVEQDLEKILGGNLLGVMRRVEDVARQMRMQTTTGEKP